MIRRSLVLLVLAAVAASGFAFAQGDAFTLRILHTNDHHSHLDGAAFDLTLDGTRTRVTLGGFSRIVTIIDAERTPNAIVLNSGELNGTLYFSVYKGEPDFLVFNALGLDAYALGNHEFDEGDARLAELVDLANFPIVSSNALPEPASPLYRVRDQVLPYVIREVEGERVGIIGILKVEKTKNSSLVSDDVAFTPEIETAARMVAELEAQGVDKIVLLSHVGYFNDLAIARAVRGIDVIVGGDSHSLLGDAGALGEIGLAPIVSNQTGPFAGASHGGLEALDLGEYPTVVRGPTGDPVLVVTAWEYAKALGVLDVTFDADGLVTGYAGSIVLPVEGPFAQPNAENQMVEVSPRPRPPSWPPSRRRRCCGSPAPTRRSRRCWSRTARASRRSRSSRSARSRRRWATPASRSRSRRARRPPAATRPSWCRRRSATRTRRSTWRSRTPAACAPSSSPAPSPSATPSPPCRSRTRSSCCR
jgi:hypothetical protein